MEEIENTGQKREGQLWQELAENINKQLDVNMKLKEVLEPIVAAFSKSKRPKLTAESTNKVKDLVIEAESLQAEGKAVFHQLFGVDNEAE